MRTQIFIFVSLMFFSLLATGQNYQTVYPDQENCFLMENNNVICLRIDSLSEGTSTILHPSRVSLQTDENCFSPFAGSWIGKEIEIRDNGENVFINHADEPVTINTLAALGEEWVAYDVPGEMEVRATVIAHDLMDFLELTDSVKTIAFQAYSAGGEPVEMDVNEMQVQISKHYGWVQPLSFYFFPAHQQWLPEMKLQELSLVGLSEPQRGIKNLTWFEVYDFQPGDVLHVFQESGDWIGEVDGYYNITETRSIFKYLERVDYEDSIQYTFSRVQRIEMAWLDSIAVFTDTLTQVITPNLLFEKLPFEPVFDFLFKDEEEVYMHYAMWQDEDGHLAKGIYNYWFNWFTDDCWLPGHVDKSGWSRYFMKGLGGPYHTLYDMFGSLYLNELVYYEKDGLTWGTPLDVSSVEKYTKSNLVKIYPNPVRESFTVTIDPSLSGEFLLSLVDVNSRSVLQQKVPSGATSINVAHLPPGIYFCMITSKQGVVHSHKMLVR